MSARVMWFITDRQAEVLYSIPSEIVFDFRVRNGEPSQPDIAIADHPQINALIRKGLVRFKCTACNCSDGDPVRTVFGQALAEHLAGVESA